MYLINDQKLIYIWCLDGFSCQIFQMTNKPCSWWKVKSYVLSDVLLLIIDFYCYFCSDPLELWIGSFSFYAVLILSSFAIFLPSFYLTLGGISPFLWFYHFFSWNRRTKVSILHAKICN